jgi:N6-adenosine-specific RNA methylase IME4
VTAPTRHFPNRHQPRRFNSEKPEFFYKLIEEQSPGPYLELFARRRWPGWDAWGNEIESAVQFP